MDGGEQQTVATTATVVTEGEWAGWSSWAGLDPFEDLAGPYYFKTAADGAVTCAMRCEHRHLNGGAFMHGGAIMTFADYCLFIIAHEALGTSPAVTVSLNGEFIGKAVEGERLETRGEVVKAGRSLLFVRGLIEGESGPVLSFSGVIKRVDLPKLRA